MAAKVRLLRKRYDTFLSTREWCERCGSPATCVHHRRGRVGSLLLDERWWAASCAGCNDFAETRTGVALSEGWLLPAFGLIPEDAA